MTDDVTLVGFAELSATVVGAVCWPHTTGSGTAPDQVSTGWS